MCLKILLLPETILRLALYRLRRVCFVQRVLCWDNQVCSILLCSVSSSGNVLTYHLNSFYSFLFTILVSCLNLFRTSQDTKPAKWQGPFSRPQKNKHYWKDLRSQSELAGHVFICLQILRNEDYCFGIKWDWNPYPPLIVTSLQRPLFLTDSHIHCLLFKPLNNGHYLLSTK